DRQARETGDGSGEQHGGEDHALGVDAAGGGGGLRGAGGAQVEAEAGAVEDDPVADAEQDGEDHQAVDLTGGAHVDAGDPAGLVHLAGGVVVADLDAEDGGQPQVADHGGRDGVEHDRRDDLADAAGDLEDAGDAGPEGSGEHGGEKQQRD